MPRGGYRLGAGRPKGSKNRPKVDAPPTSVGPVAAPAREDASPPDQKPLDYMLSVMRNGDAHPERRDRMAVAAAPYVHGKVGEKGKKAEKEEAAKKLAGSPRFGATAPPLRLVDKSH